MTGDIDDVANLVTPSPRDRNPGKIQTSSNNVKYIKVTETEGDYQDADEPTPRQGDATTVKHSAML